MAQGDMIIFDAGLVNFGNGFNVGADTWNYGIVDNTTPPTRDTADPSWGAGGTTDYSALQVATGGTSYTGPVALASGVWSEAVANTFRLDFADPATLAQDASGFTDGYWMIGYNDTDANKDCLFAIDLGGPISLVGGSLDVNFHANGIFQVT